MFKILGYLQYSKKYVPIIMFSVLFRVLMIAVDIGLDKNGYQVNSFLISRRKHMLWVLIRMSTHNICFRREIRKI